MKATRPISRLIALLLCALLAVGSAAQEAGDEPQSPSAPNLLSLQKNWWIYFDGPQSEVKLRVSEFLAIVESQTADLGPQNQLIAQSILDAVRDNLDVYVKLLDTRELKLLELVEPAASYTIEELFMLAANAREAESVAASEQLEVERERRILNGATQRRDALFKDYIDSAEGDERWLTALRLVRARAAQEISKRRLEILEQSYEYAIQNAENARERVELAIGRLTSDADAKKLEAMSAELSAKQSAVDKAQEKQRQAQIAASSLALDTPQGRSEQRLQQQRLLDAEIRLAAAEIELASTEAKRWWAESQLDTGAPLSEIEDRTLAWSELVRELGRQMPEWQRQTEDELLAVQSVDRDGLNRASRRLLDQRLGTAQDTLALIGNLDAAVADFELLMTVVDNAVAEQSGALHSWLVTVSRFAKSAYLRVLDVADTTLFSVGETPVTGSDILRALVILLFAFLLSAGIRKAIRRVGDEDSPGTTASLYTISRLTHYSIIILAVFIALPSIGLDLSNLALVAGALSVGIGFGLQSIVNNFVSGLIILFERSLRVGDYIELDTGLTGTVKSINVRSTLINTNDNIDIVVPNSEFVSTRLTNWTLGERILRVRIPFGVAYGSDKELVRKAAMEAAEEVPYTLTHMPGREPDIWLVEYGDNSLNFLLLVWVNRQGARRPTRTRAAYLWALETKLNEYGIEIPFPQRDLHFRSGWNPLEDSPRLRPASPQNPDGGD
jgi:small-conductance mechanosensitive channel